MLTFENSTDMFVWSMAHLRPDAYVEDSDAEHMLMDGPMSIRNRDADYLLTDEDRANLEKYKGAIVHEIFDGSVTVEYFESRDELTAAWDNLENSAVEHWRIVNTIDNAASVKVEE
jgi:hypothetical protein